MSTLIVRGVSEVDQLKALGLPMARRYAEADNVIFITGAQARAIKGLSQGDRHPMEYIDADPVHGLVVQLMNRIKAEYEECHPGTQELAHSFVGQWLFYFIAPPDMVVIDAIAAGETEKLRKSAEMFIESDFGREPIDTISADGRTASSNSTPAGVPRDERSGQDVRRDS